MMTPSRQPSTLRRWTRRYPASIGSFRCALFHLDRFDGKADAIDAAELLLPLLLLLEQAVTATARDRPTAGTSRLR